MFQALAIIAAIAAAVTAYKASTVKADPSTLHAPHDVIYLNTMLLKAARDANEESAR